MISHPKYWGTWVVASILWLLSFWPLPLLYGLGTILGNALYGIASARRQIAIQNLRLCFPELTEKGIKHLAFETFRNIGRITMVSGIVWWSGAQRLQRLVRVENSEHYENALASGRNLLLLVPHFIAQEIGGIYLSTTRRYLCVYQHNRNPIFDRLMLGSRSRFGAILVERKSNTKRLIREIKNGNPLYYLPDQDPGIQWDKRQAVFAPFFGVQTATWATLARLANITNALVLPCATKLLPAGQGFQIIFEPPLKDFPTGNPVLDTTLMNHVIEGLVRQMPDQYFWVHKRFKTRPSGEKSYYS